MSPKPHPPSEKTGRGGIGSLVRVAVGRVSQQDRRHAQILKNVMAQQCLRDRRADHVNPFGPVRKVGDQVAHRCVEVDAVCAGGHADHHGGGLPVPRDYRSQVDFDLTQIPAQALKILGRLGHRFQETSEVQCAGPYSIRMFRSQTGYVGLTNAFDFRNGPRQLLHERQRVHVVDAVRVVGLNEDDDRILMAELIADRAIDMDLGRVLGHQGMTVRAQLQTKITRRDRQRNQQPERDDQPRTTNGKPVQPGQW